MEEMGKRTLSKRSSSITLHPGNHERTGVKCASMNTVYGPDTDLSFMENFIESTKIYSTAASNASPLTHDCFIRKKGFILLSEVYKVSKEILETPVYIFPFLFPFPELQLLSSQTALHGHAADGDSGTIVFYTIPGV